MPESPSIPLLQATAPVSSQFCDFRTPQDLLNFIVANIVANGDALSGLFPNQIIISSTQPMGADLGKIWVKNVGADWGIYLYINGEYVNATGLSSGIITWYQGNTAPSGWSIYTNSDLDPPPSGLIYISKN